MCGESICTGIRPVAAGAPRQCRQAVQLPAEFRELKRSPVRTAGHLAPSDAMRASARQANALQKAALPHICWCSASAVMVAAPLCGWRAGCDRPRDAAPAARPCIARARKRRGARLADHKRLRRRVCSTSPPSYPPALPFLCCLALTDSHHDVFLRLRPRARRARLRGAPRPRRQGHRARRGQHHRPRRRLRQGP